MRVIDASPITLAGSESSATHDSQSHSQTSPQSPLNPRTRHGVSMSPSSAGNDIAPTHPAPPGPSTRDATETPDTSSNVHPNVTQQSPSRYSFRPRFPSDQASLGKFWRIQGSGTGKKLGRPKADGSSPTTMEPGKLASYRKWKKKGYKGTRKRKDVGRAKKNTLKTLTEVHEEDNNAFDIDMEDWRGGLTTSPGPVTEDGQRMRVTEHLMDEEPWYGDEGGGGGDDDYGDYDMAGESMPADDAATGHNESPMELDSHDAGSEDVSGHNPTDTPSLGQHITVRRPASRGREHRTVIPGKSWSLGHCIAEMPMLAFGLF